MTAAPSARARLDVFISGLVFMDVIFTGLPSAPVDGTEIFASGLGSAPGGRANLAIALSRLGLHVGLSAGFSEDGYGAFLWRTLAAEGVDLSASHRLPAWPTPLTVSLSHDADRSFITYIEPLPAHGVRQLETAASQIPAAAGCFVGLQREAPCWLAERRKAGSTVFADVAWDATGKWAPSVLDRLEMIDVFMPNSVEAMAYTRTASPEAALAALASRVPVCAVKDGGRGAIACDAGTGEMASAAAIPVAVLDATGAGDVFDAGFIYGTLQGWPLAERLKFANLCAGLSVRHRSGSLGSPGWAEIAAWIASAELPPEIRAGYGFVAQYIPEPAAGHITRASPTVCFDA